VARPRGTLTRFPILPNWGTQTPNADTMPQKGTKHLLCLLVANGLLWQDAWP